MQCFTDRIATWLLDGNLYKWLNGRQRYENTYVFVPNSLLHLSNRLFDMFSHLPAMFPG